jgi:hypothetical protein
MARGKYLSLEEARKKKGGLKRFAKEHPSEGDADAFARALRDMIRDAEKQEAKDQTSSGAASEGCTETRTPKGTSGDA